MQNQKPGIGFQVEGNEKIGLGHFYRALALAQMLKSEFEIYFFLSPESFSLKSKLEDSFNVVEVKTSSHNFFSAYLKEGEWLVLDGYHFTKEYVKDLRQKFLVAYVDDLGNELDANLIINHALGWDRKDYSVKYDQQLALGNEYAILRPDFLAKERIPPELNHVFICFGGADPENYTRKVLENVKQNYICHVVIGARYVFHEELNALVETNDHIHLYKDLDAFELIELMQKCSFAVTSASTIAYEFAAVSNGSLFVLQTADNQLYLYKGLIKNKFAFPYNEKLEAFTSPRWIDGKSPERFLKLFMNGIRDHKVEVKNMTQEDIETVYEWANDEEVRKMSYNSEPIKWENHVAWMTKILASNVPFYLLMHGDEKIGQIRFTIDGTKATIGFLVAPNQRGKGWGEVVLRKGIQQLLVQHPEIRTVNGFVKQSNKGSLRSFEKCNFVQMETSDYPDSFEMIIEV